MIPRSEFVHIIMCLIEEYLMILFYYDSDGSQESEEVFYEQLTTALSREYSDLLG